MPSPSRALLFLLLVVAAVFAQAPPPLPPQQQCLSDSALAAALPPPTDRHECCQKRVCGVECPRAVPPPATGFRVAVIVAIVLSFVVGVATLFLIRGNADNFFVAGRSLPLYVVAVSLASQSIDSNALLANAHFSFTLHLFDGAVIPIGLGLSLVLNAVFLAARINRERVLTLPDIFAKRYGRTVEMLVSLATITSFLFLLAGNLVGMGAVLSYLLDMRPSTAVWIAAAVVCAYTASGGLFSVAYTDLVQGVFGWLGCLACAFWFIHNVRPAAAPPSRGFPSYVYPDRLGDRGVCDAYSGVACAFNRELCCFGASNHTDNGAFPIGDRQVFANQMLSPTALSPFPNALLWNWATIFILAFGNLAALDFQARCMASRSPRVATLGCVIAGCLTFVVGIPFSYLGSITR